MALPASHRLPPLPMAHPSLQHSSRSSSSPALSLAPKGALALTVMPRASSQPPPPAASSSSSSSSDPAAPASPSHFHLPALPPATSLERYWPFVAVTIASIYLITLMPFIAPGMFLLQYSLLRYIRRQSEKNLANAPSSAAPPHIPHKARSRRPSSKVPVMDVIVEEDPAEAAAEEEGKPKASPEEPVAKLATPLPLHYNRPPPLVIPRYNAGVITAPLPLSLPPSIPSASLPALVATFPASFPPATPSRSWPAESLDLNESLQSLLHSSMLTLERSSSEGHQNLLAATAALFAPSIFQSLASPPLVTPSQPSSPSLLSPTSPRCPPVAARGAATRKSPFTFMRVLPLSPLASVGAEGMTRVEGEREEWSSYQLEGMACAV